MTIPLWLLIATVVVLVALAIVAVLSTLAWGGAQVELRELRARTKLIQIDVFARRVAVPADREAQARLR